jgi:F0F1-type ATP synthase assembly protein I
MTGRPWWVALGQLTGVGWYIATAIVAPTLGGLWLDEQVGTRPLFLLVGLVLGIATAFCGTYRMLRIFVESGGRGGTR